MKTIKTLRDVYNFPGFRARATLKAHQKDTDGYIVKLERRQKKLFALAVVKRYQVFVTDALIWFETWMLVQPAYTLNLNTAELSAHVVKP